MKKRILYLCGILLLIIGIYTSSLTDEVNINYAATQTKNSSGIKVEVVRYDGCEYIVAYRFYRGNITGGVTHKGNCDNH